MKEREDDLENIFLSYAFIYLFVEAPLTTRHRPK
jgi:hypothetical protein